MPRKSTKKIGKFRYIEDRCLSVAFYRPRTVACLNSARVYLCEWGKEYTWDYYLENDKAVDFRYALGGMYYDFVKYVRRGKAWKKKN